MPRPFFTLIAFVVFLFFFFGGRTAGSLVSRETPILHEGVTDDGRLSIVHVTLGEYVPSNTKISDHHRDIRAFVLPGSDRPSLYLEEAKTRNVYEVDGADLRPLRASLKWVGPTSLTFVSDNANGTWERYVLDVSRLKDENETLTEKPQLEDIRPIVDAVF